MYGTDSQARKEVNNAIDNAGGSAVGQMVDTANSSIEKRRKNKEQREQREAEQRSKDQAAVRTHSHSF
jgi:hypothetical protein